jgi:hypothetical protein
VKHLNLNRQWIKIGSTLLCAVLLSSCAPGFKANSIGGLDNNGSSGTPANGWDKVDVQGDVVDNSGTYDKTSAISLDKEHKEIVVTMPIPLNPLIDSQLNVAIPEIEGAKLSVETQADGSKALTLRIPLEKYLRGIEFLPPTALPNGDPLPAIPDGELPSIAVKISRWADIKATIYLAPQVVGVFVESPIDPRIGLTFPIRNAARTQTWGYLSTIPAKTDYVGGFFLSFQMPDAIARMIDDLL